MKENFIGEWMLIPEMSKYEQGIPPVEATYFFAEGENGSLNVAIEWANQEREEFRVEYMTIPDGQRKKYDNPQIADEVMSEFITDRQLNSYTYKGGKIIAFASRIINEDDIMEVIQRFYTSDGKEFDNVQYYKRLGE